MAMTLPSRETVLAEASALAADYAKAAKLGVEQVISPPMCGDVARLLDDLVSLLRQQEEQVRQIVEYTDQMSHLLGPGSFLAQEWQSRRSKLSAFLRSPSTDQEPR